MGSMTFWVSSDRDHHVGDHPLEHLRTCELAEVAEWGTRIVVHQDVGLRTGAQQRRLPLRGGDIRLHGGYLGAGCLAKLGGGLLQGLAVPAIDGHLAARFSQGARAGAAEPAAGGTDDGLAAGNSEIHGMSDCYESGDGAGLYTVAPARCPVVLDRSAV
jgi:hypothetical protein